MSRPVDRFAASAPLLGFLALMLSGCGGRSALLGEDDWGAGTGARPSSGVSIGGAGGRSGGGNKGSGGWSSVGGSAGHSGGRPGSGGDDAGGGGFASAGGTFGARPVLCDPEEDSSCRNGGECVASASDTHQCLCRPGTFGPHCDDFIIQATPHCLLGSDGYVRDCSPKFIRPDFALPPLQRISSDYHYGAVKGEHDVYAFSGLGFDGRPVTATNGVSVSSPPLILDDILVRRGRYFGLGEGALVSWHFDFDSNKSQTISADVTNLIAGDYGACGLDSDRHLRCWTVDDIGWQYTPAAYGERLRAIAGPSSSPAAVTEDGQLLCPSPMQCEAIVDHGPFTHVDAFADVLCAIDEGGEAHCTNGLDFAGPFEWGAIQGLEYEAVRFCGSRRGTHEFNCYAFSGNLPTLPPEENVIDVAINDSCIWVINAAGELACYPRYSDSRFAVALSSPPGSFDKLWGGMTTCARRTSPTDQVECWNEYNDSPSLYPGQFSDFHPTSGCSVGDAGFTCSSWRADLPLIDLSSGPTLCGITSDRGLLCDPRFATDAPPRDRDTGEEITGDFIDIQGGKDFNCALEKSGRVQCWGSSATKTRSPPGRFQQISCSRDSCCGVAEDSGVDCFGGRHLVSPLAGEFQRVAVWESTVCAIRTDQTLLCRDDVLVRE